MAKQGKWKNGSLQLLWNSSAAVFGTPMSNMRFYTNDWTPQSGWVDADVTILAATQALATRPGAWQSAVVQSDGIVYRTTAASWLFTLALLIAPTLVYGYVISQGTNTSPLYASRFDDGPYLITNATVIAVQPLVYFHNPDVDLP